MSSASFDDGVLRAGSRSATASSVLRKSWALSRSRGSNGLDVHRLCQSRVDRPQRMGQETVHADRDAPEIENPLSREQDIRAAAR